MRGFRFLDRSLSISSPSFATSALSRSLEPTLEPSRSLQPLDSNPSSPSRSTLSSSLATESLYNYPPIVPRCRPTLASLSLSPSLMSDKTLDRPKRSQVRIACTACRTSKAGCSDQRPCTRCSSLNIQCVDAPRRRPRGSKLIELERVVKKLMAHVRTVGRPATSFPPSIVTLVIIVAALGVAHHRANGAFSWAIGALRVAVAVDVAIQVDASWSSSACHSESLVPVGTCTNSLPRNRDRVLSIGCFTTDRCRRCPGR